MNAVKRCDGISRRDFLRVGGLAALGLGLGDFFHLQRAFAGNSPLTAKAKSCILIWLDGGPSHLETFDPKPDAPQEVRGPLKTIPTNVTGVRISECLGRTAAIMDKIAIIRSMTSPLGEHSLGTQYLMTGYKPTPALEYPTFGATLAFIRSQSSKDSPITATENNAVTTALPPNIAVPNFTREVSGNGYLPSATRPFSVGGNPNKDDFKGSNGGFKVRDLDFYQGIDIDRLSRRRQFVNALNEFSSAKDAGALTVSDPELERAYNLITSPEAKAAFSLSEEPQEVRHRYGTGGVNGIGLSCLLARRLVERSVPFVTVNHAGWDTHQDIFTLKERYPTDRNAHLPSLDKALSALIQDLTDRRMLNETLVVVMGEFGRTPKINSQGGRDHWPNVFSVMLAGGGVQGGQIVGSSDVLGEFPKERPVTPSDLSATIYTLLGIDPGLELHTSDGRPVRVAPDGANVVSELIA
ncbi:DUF1501 domain-containing protein [Candidatus Poribacteria bacterium]|nr:DUF1501 domain-containing protein [Candidatus Poribacteria bacterium]